MPDFSEIDRLCSGIYDMFRSVIPRPQDRIILGTCTWPYLLIPLPPIFFMAYLARRPNTHRLRLMLLPITIFCCLRAGFGFAWVEPKYNNYNYATALCSVVIISKALEYGLTAEGMRKVGEDTVGQYTVTPGQGTGDSKSNSKYPLSPSRSGQVLYQSISNAVELLCSLRGIGFEYGVGVKIPSETRSPDKKPFLRATIILFFRSYLALDFIDSLLKYTPPLRTPLGGSIFLPSLPRLQRYVVSTLIHTGTGCGIIEAFQLVYYLCSIINVGLLNDSPTGWPPMFDHPWRSDSLHDFWSRRWHQSLRRVFMIFGGLPGEWIGGHFGCSNVGVVFGTFIASGLYHEIPAYALGKGLDWRVPAFFVLHAFLVFGEQLWKQITGKKVAGRWGRAWVCFATIVLGQNLVDSWHTRGIGGGLIVPPLVSPMRRMLLPVMFRLANYLNFSILNDPSFSVY